MALIPQYESKVKASTEAPAVMQRSQDLGPMADPNLVKKGAGQEIAQNIFELGQKIKQVEDTNDKYKAEIETTQGMLALEEQITKDPSTFKDYDSQMNKIANSATKNFRNSDARDKYTQEVGLKNVIFKNKMQAVVYKHEVDLGRTNTITAMDMESSNYINASDDSEKLASRQKIESLMAGAVKQGLFTSEDGYKEVEKTIKDAETAVKDRKALQAREQKELAWAQKEAVNARENEFITMRVKGVDKLGTPISRAELIDMARSDMDKGSISPKFTETYINALKSPKSVNAKTVDKDFADIISDINAGIKSPERIRSSMLKSVEDGYLSEDDFSAASTYFEMLSSKSPDDLVTMDMRKSWRGIEVFSENNQKKEESRSRMSRSFINKIQSGVDPQTASIEAMREEVLFNLPSAIQSAEGIEVMDDSGRIKKIMSNGDIVEINSTKKDTRVKEKK